MHMLPSNESMVEAKTAAMGQLDEHVKKLEKYAASGVQLADDGGKVGCCDDDLTETHAALDRAMATVFNCSMQMFVQLQPLPPQVKMAQLLEYERELQYPQGISTIHPPPPMISSVIYSPECGLVLSVDHEEGIKIESYYNKAVSHAAMASGLAIIQIFTMIYQMEYTPTPSVSL